MAWNQIFTGAFFAGHVNYWLFIVLMMTGLYVVVTKGNLVKKIVGLNLFQSSVCMFYISMGKVSGGTAPIFKVNRSGELLYDPHTVYTNPIPSVLILTAIVVGIATTALGLALVVRIRESFGTIEEESLHEIQLRLIAAESAQHGHSMGETI